MAEASRGWLLRKRNILGAALVAGIGLGIYLGKLPFLGFGMGDGSGKHTNGKTDSTSGDSETTGNEPAMVSTVSEGELPTAVPDVVKVLIDERDFLLRKSNEDVPISLGNLIHLIKLAPGDGDGVRLRIYERSSARVSAEEKLKQALLDANVPDSAVFWVPTQVKDFEMRRSDQRKSK